MSGHVAIMLGHLTKHQPKIEALEASYVLNSQADCSPPACPELEHGHDFSYLCQASKVLSSLKTQSISAASGNFIVLIAIVVVVA